MDMFATVEDEVESHLVVEPTYTGSFVSLFMGLFCYQYPD